MGLLSERPAAVARWWLLEDIPRHRMEFSSLRPNQEPMLAPVGTTGRAPRLLHRRRIYDKNPGAVRSLSFLRRSLQPTAFPSFETRFDPMQPKNARDDGNTPSA